MKQLLILLLLILTACGTYRNNSDERQLLKGIEVQALQDSLVRNAKDITNLAKSDKTITTDKTITVTKEVTFSKPDSTGLQYKLLERTTEQRNDYEVKNDISEWLLQIKDEQIERLKHQNKNLQFELDKHKESRVNVRSRSPLGWFVLMYVLGMATVIVFRVWKSRYRL